MALTRLPSPIDEMDSMRRMMDRMFHEPWFRPMSWFRDTDPGWPRVDMYATDEEHVVEAALPGVKPDDVKVTLEDHTLTIRGSYAHDEDRTESGYSLREIREGEFSRSLTLTGDIKPEDVKAEFKDGILRVSIPRSEASKPRAIDVKVK